MGLVWFLAAFLPMGRVVFLFLLMLWHEVLGIGFSGIQVGLGLSVEVEAFGRALVS